jgi:hypothetical protein
MSSSKRARSSSVSPPPKRARHENVSANEVALNFHHPPIPESGGSIRHIVASHEIFLNVLGFLPAEDLTRVEGVSREWRNMALDSHVSLDLFRCWFPLTDVSANSFGEISIWLGIQDHLLERW